jgi:streptogramin lyase
MTANFIYTIAGGGATTTPLEGILKGSVPTHVLATNCSLSAPRGICVDSAGNVYIADSNNGAIKIVQRTFENLYGYDRNANCMYTLSNQYNQPNSVFVDSSKNIYIADTGYHRIKFQVRGSGTTNFGVSNMTRAFVYTIAGIGSGTTVGTFGPGTNGGVATGATTNSALSSPQGVFVDSEFNVYIADTDSHRIKFIPRANGTYFGRSMVANSIYWIAGTGTSGSGSDGVLPTTSALHTPRGVYVDSAGNICLGSKDVHKIRFIPKVTGTYYGIIMTANFIYTIAGTATTASGTVNNILAKDSQLFYPQYIFVDSGRNIYIADWGSSTIGIIASNICFAIPMKSNYIYTIAGTGSAAEGIDGVIASISELNNPRGIFVNSAGNVYISDSDNKKIKFIPNLSGTYFGKSMIAKYIYTIAGTGIDGASGDNGEATSSTLSIPHGIFVDSAGNIYIADTNNHKIRFIPSATGIYFGRSMISNFIYMIVGTGSEGPGSEGALGTNSALRSPKGVFLDSGGNLYIADSDNHRIKFIPSATATYFGISMQASRIYTIAGNGNFNGAGSDGVLATNSQLNTPTSVSVDSAGNLYIADSRNNKIRFIPKETGIYFGNTATWTANSIYTIAGGGASGNIDYVAATNSTLSEPRSIFVDSDGNLYITDTNNKKIKFIPKVTGTYYGNIMTANFIYTIAGTGVGGGNGDNGLATNSQLNDPYGVFVDSARNVYIADNNHKIRVINIAKNYYFNNGIDALILPNSVYNINNTTNYNTLNYSASLSIIS